MNKLTLGLTLLLTYGCSQPILNSSLSIPPVDSSPGCPEKPIINLDQQTVEEINLDQSLVKSGRVTSTKSVGYRFDAKSGQTLSYSTNDDVCIVIYTPDNQIIDSGELTISGKHILEVSAPQGIRAFNLSMSLTTPQPISNEPIAVNPPPTPTPTPVQTEQPTPQPPRVAPQRVSQPVHNISQEEALPSANNQSAIEGVVNSFYSELNRGNYQNSWNKLSYKLQNNQQDHPDGYNSYIQWWTKVSRVEPRIIKSEFNDNYGTVNVRSKLYLNSGKVINAVVQYNLVWNPDYEKWEINKIRLIS
ncbi:hypothetical protein [Umezakia ovalisporum]|uniref:hypothetical protein n=1 Tax=Umezakia ovalisporum TaxID=75695 RepID=UPI0006F03690|nr:hypothetical protein [Umezakia ovalisporum]MDH6088557.1 hypothetical protein [Umezakia ovalisporum Ak1311]CEJ46708.1 Uncharacterized protein apha_02658 [Umezakia ovalisporum]